MTRILRIKFRCKSVKSVRTKRNSEQNIQECDSSLWLTCNLLLISGEKLSPEADETEA